MLSQNSPVSEKYFDKYHSRETPPLVTVATKACAPGILRFPTSDVTTGISKAGVPTEPKAYQISTAERKNKAQMIDNPAETKSPSRVSLTIWLSDTFLIRGIISWPNVEPAKKE